MRSRELRSACRKSVAHVLFFRNGTESFLCEGYENFKYIRTPCMSATKVAGTVGEWSGKICSCKLKSGWESGASADCSDGVRL